MNSIWGSDEGRAAVHSRYADMLGRWPVPSEQRKVPTREGETFIVACGPASAPPVLLLQGSGANTAMWIEELKRLTMPVMAIVGAHDVLLDSHETKRRLEQRVPHATVRLLPDAGHVVRDHTAAVLEFLRLGAESAASTVSAVEVDRQRLALQTSGFQC